MSTLSFHFNFVKILLLAEIALPLTKMSIFGILGMFSNQLKSACGSCASALQSSLAS